MGNTNKSEAETKPKHSIVIGQIIIAILGSYERLKSFIYLFGEHEREHKYPMSIFI